jgi:mono/diheme cytochrome c family protein
VKAWHNIACSGFVLAACAAAPLTAPTGAETYARHCAACHGAAGAGDGPVSSEMRVGVPDLRGLSVRNGGEFPADRVARYIDGRDPPAAHGDRRMPVWGPVFDTTARLISGAEGAEARIQELIVHLRTLQRP